MSTASIDYVGVEALELLRATLAARLPPGASFPFRRIAREFLQIQTEDNRVVPFLLRPLQLRYLARKRLARWQGRPPRYLLLKYRRGGYTTIEQGLSYYMASRRRNVTLMTMAQDQKTTARIFRIAQLMHERDPKAPPIKGPGNQYRLEFPGLRSLFYLETAGSRGIARGDTLSRIHWSEVAWSCEGPNQRHDQRKLLIGMQEAAKAGEIVLETTPNGSEFFRELYMDARRGRNDWTAIFLPWYADPLNRDEIEDRDEAAYVLEDQDEEDEEEIRLRKRIGLDANQVKWRRRKRRELGPEFYQEYPEDDETCWLMTGSHYFDPKTIMRLRDEIDVPELMDDASIGLRPPDSRTIPGGYEVEWEPPQQDVVYVAGVDTSEGNPDSDPNGIGIMRRDNGQQVYEAHGIFGIRELAELCAKVSKRYNRALLGIERNNHGHAVIQKVVDHGYGREHHHGGSLYFHSKAKREKVDDRPVRRAGWDTNTITRPLLLSGLRDYVEDVGAVDRVRSRLLLSECLTFRKQGDGKYEADSGCHDDAILKWGIANQMRGVNWRTGGMTVHDVTRWRR